MKTVLRLRRESAGLSREALARRVDRSTSLISAMERGLVTSQETAERIAAVLGCSVDDVLHKTPLEAVCGGVVEEVRR